MQQIIFVIHILAAAALIGLVLIQHGKGADVGASFGSGASNTMFGSIGSMPFLIKLTGLVAAIFFITSISLGFITSRNAKHTTALPLPATQQQTITIPAQKTQQQTVTIPAQKTQQQTITLPAEKKTIKN